MMHISLGMSKAEVINILGTPDSVSANKGVEYLSYTLRTETSFTRNTWGYQSNYFVRLVDGKVESYGRVGDFDSTRNPTLDVNIRQR